jgi:predicted aconitase
VRGGRRAVVKLSDQDKRMLEGERGPAQQEAMEFLVKFGEAFEAEEMVDLHKAHLFADYSGSVEVIKGGDRPSEDG